jgi:uncharacterized coiled-coil protein SlyX
VGKKKKANDQPQLAVMDEPEEVADQATNQEPEPTPEAVAAWEASLSTLKEMVTELSVEIANTKAHMKSLKANFDAATEQYARVKNRGPETMPLFDAQKPVEWKSLPVRELPGLIESLYTKLEDAGLGTLGDLRAKIEADPMWWWQSVKSVGTTAAEKIAEAWQELFAQRPDIAQAIEGEPAKE